MIDKQFLWIFLLRITIITALYDGDPSYWHNNSVIDCNERKVSNEQLCDGIDHCTDSSDEENCMHCRGGAFHCNNDRCIPNYLVKDTFDDCGDGSDEVNDITVSNVYRTSKIRTTRRRSKIYDGTILDFSKGIKVFNEETNTIDFAINMFAYEPDDKVTEYDARSLIYEHMEKVVFYIHGYWTKDLKDSYEFKDALIDGADDIDCIILVDWTAGSFFDHGWWTEHNPWHMKNEYELVATTNVPEVGNFIASFIREKIPKSVKIHLIGFSLGAHIAGTAARVVEDKTRRSIERISAIDPAGPIFEHSMYNVYNINTENTLRVSDADFVDVIHSSGVLGMSNAAGHIDIYMSSRDCTVEECKHHRAIVVYMKSLTSCSQITCPADYHINNMCKAPLNLLSSLGYLADMYPGRGEHVIRFYNPQPDTETECFHLCNDLHRVDLPAKHRVCHKPPSATSNCRSLPYLAECTEDCGFNNLLTTMCVAGEFIDRVSWIGEKCKKPIACMDEYGNQVEYFVAYKIPDSFEYFYYSRSEKGPTWQKGFYPISDAKSVLGLTLFPIYEQVEPITYMMWNDQIPYSSKEFEPFNEHSQNGHSKGVLAYNIRGGFLLSHSIPGFPEHVRLTGRYQYPKSGRRYAQMAVCVSSNTEKQNMEDEMLNLLDMMKSFKPQVYDPHAQTFLPKEILDKFEEVVYPKPAKLGKPAIEFHNYGADYINIHSFGKSKKKLFKDSSVELAVLYGTPLIAQTWSHHEPLPSSCEAETPTVENVKSIQIFDEVNNKLISWVGTKDHSKWFISKSDTMPVMCIGDLNRAVATMTRGGMFVCIQDPQLYSALRSQIQITELEKCPDLPNNFNSINDTVSDSESRSDSYFDPSSSSDSDSESRSDTVFDTSPNSDSDSESQSDSGFDPSSSFISDSESRSDSVFDPSSSSVSDSEPRSDSYFDPSSSSDSDSESRSDAVFDTSSNSDSDSESHSDSGSDPSSSFISDSESRSDSVFDPSSSFVSDSESRSDSHFDPSSNSDSDSESHSDSGFDPSSSSDSDSESHSDSGFDPSFSSESDSDYSSDSDTDYNSNSDSDYSSDSGSDYSSDSDSGSASIEDIPPPNKASDSGSAKTKAMPPPNKPSDSGSAKTEVVPPPNKPSDSGSDSIKGVPPPKKPKIRRLRFG